MAGAVVNCRACGLPVVVLPDYMGVVRVAEPHTVRARDRVFSAGAGHVQHRSFCTRKKVRLMGDYTPEILGRLTTDQLTNEADFTAKWDAANASLILLVDTHKANQAAIAAEQARRKAENDEVI